MFIRKSLSTAEIFGYRKGIARAQPEDLFETDQQKNLKRFDTYWLEDLSLKLPLVIVAKAEDKALLFADVATYYPQYSPISAYIHIAEEFDENKFDRLRPRSLFEIRLWIALIEAEAMSSIVANKDDGDITYSLCKRTLSYTIARASHIYKEVEPDTIAEKWLQLRLITKLDYQIKVSSVVVLITNILFPSRSGPSSKRLLGDFGKKIETLIATQSHDEFQNYLNEIYSGIDKFSSDLKGNFDGRIYAFEKIVAFIKANSHSNEVDTLAIAFFCNLILPGSFNYLKYLSKFFDENPAVLVWYAFFTSLEDFDYAKSFSGVGLKLHRDISAPFTFNTYPSCDISVDELRALSRLEVKHNVLKPIQQKLILVSLLPGVEVFSRIPSDAEESADPRGLTTLQNSTISTARQKKLLDLLEEARRILTDRNGDTVLSKPTPKSSRRSFKK